LLLKKSEVDKIVAEIQSGGHAIVPLKIYFKHGLAKCLLAVGKGKKQHDKRQDIKERESKREISRAMSRRR
jgi:SsrA-binding protein